MVNREKLKELLEQELICTMRIIEFLMYNGVTVGVITDSDGNTGTIFPDTLKRKVAEIND